MAFLLFALAMVASANGCVLTKCGSGNGCGHGSVGGHGNGCGFGGFGHGNGCGHGSGYGVFGRGGHGGHGHGICDCDEDDYCTSRTPWVRQGGFISPNGAVLPAGEPIPAPKDMPKDVLKKKL
jgi:hypothetical protein